MDRTAILAYTAEQYGTEPDCPWPEYPEHQVLRHSKTRKWYGLIMAVDRDKLGLPGDGIVDILNVKSEPGVVYLSKDTPGILPAYHMNKQHWISILLDGTLDDDRTRSLLDASYAMTR